MRLFAKFDGLNPTGSFKDRGMTMAVTRAAEEGARAIICASTGNTSASAAAYAARAGMACFVLIPEGKIALGKLSQAMMHGSAVLQIRGNFDDGMRLVQEIGRTLPVNIVNSINPYRLQGQKTIAFEVIEALGAPPDYHALPVGNAGNITAHWIGYSESAGVETRALKTDRGHARVPHARRSRAPADHAGLPGLGRGAHRARAAGGKSRDRGDRDPHRQPGVLGAGGRGEPRIGRLVRGCTRRGDPAQCRSCWRRPKGCSASRPRRSRWRAC